jgi:hypothetical protein
LDPPSDGEEFSRVVPRRRRRQGHLTVLPPVRDPLPHESAAFDPELEPGEVILKPRLRRRLAARIAGVVPTGRLPGLPRLVVLRRAGHRRIAAGSAAAAALAVAAVLAVALPGSSSSSRAGGPLVTSGIAGLNSIVSGATGAAVNSLRRLGEERIAPRSGRRPSVRRSAVRVHSTATTSTAGNAAGAGAPGSSASPTQSNSPAPSQAHEASSGGGGSSVAGASGSGAALGVGTCACGGNSP